MAAPFGVPGCSKLIPFRQFFGVRGSPPIFSPQQTIIVAFLFIISYYGLRFYTYVYIYIYISNQKSKYVCIYTYTHIYAWLYYVYEAFVADRSCPTMVYPSDTVFLLESVCLLDKAFPMS